MVLKLPIKGEKMFYINNIHLKFEVVYIFINIAPCTIMREKMNEAICTSRINF